MEQKNHLAWMRYQAKDAHPNWHHPSLGVDFYSLKSDCFAIFAQLGIKTDSLTLISDRAGPAFHPGQSLTFALGKTILGCCGKLHPDFCANLDNVELYAAELQLDEILNKVKPSLQNAPILCDFPTVERDLCFLLPQKAAGNNLVKCVLDFNKKLIKKVDLFDVYMGPEILGEYKAITIRISLQASDHTLNETEIEDFIQNLLAFVEKKCGFCLRT
jgi:phenylalanyl-tRNA synthetase beta chain